MVHYRNGLSSLAYVKDSLIGKSVKEVIEYSKERSKNNKYKEVLNLSNKIAIQYSFKLDVTSFDKNDTEKGLANVLTYEVENLTDKSLPVSV